MTSNSFDLGTLAEVPSDTDVQPPQTFDAVAADSGNDGLTDDEIIEKAIDDVQEAPSRYMQDIDDYRCWASLVWWRTVFGNEEIPQDDSQESRIARSDYCAKVGVHHMKQTPWLAMLSDEHVSREIECETTEFHAELVRAVLNRFVAVTPPILSELEKILKPLSSETTETIESDVTKLIICDRYEYIPEADAIRSYVRAISFTVTQAIENVQDAKNTEERVKCVIEYNDYDAAFNQRAWSKASAEINAEQKKAGQDLIQLERVDCPP